MRRPQPLLPTLALLALACGVSAAASGQQASPPPATLEEPSPAATPVAEPEVETAPAPGPPESAPAGDAAAGPTAPPAAATEPAPEASVEPATALPVEPEPADEPAAPQVERIDLTPPSTPEPSLRRRDLCAQEQAGSRDLVEESSVVLAETFCAATLWFDGLFGGEADVGNARAVSGRVELTALHTDFDGDDFKARLRLRYDLPNLERRVRLFLGREPDDDFVADRQEGFAVRSSVFGLEGEEEWLAGLGWSPPGRWQRRFDVSVGGRVKSAPEIFVQTRYRYNFFVGEHTVWRFRETLFYENREGYGSTTSLDLDRVLRDNLLLRWGNVGTWSEENDGLEWRSAAVLYRNLRRTRAIAGELFSRGATNGEVKIREYGGRLIYREPLRRPYLFGEVIVGYTWPRHERDQPREGSTMIGFGLELLFGRDPY